jgi:hypothetical protein
MLNIYGTEWHHIPENPTVHMFISTR